MSQTQLSELSGVPQTTISAIEHGVKTSAINLNKLANALNISMEDLIREDYESF
jgi:transcriptional regulator with XRE-family HTH domain